MTINTVIKKASQHSVNQTPYPISEEELKHALKCLRTVCKEEFEALSAISDYLVPQKKQIWAWNCTAVKLKLKRVVRHKAK